MNEKEKLILEVINGGKEGLENTQKEHEGMIEDYRENGFTDVHPNNVESIKTGLHYTHGYCIGHLELLKKVDSLLSMSKDEIKELIKENEEIKKENVKHFDGILKEIKRKNKNK